jgi:glycosyltransferase involved in cell wall biosynthesis
MTQIWIIYPFTANTLGTTENYFWESNRTNAFFVALRRIQKETGSQVSVVYLTDAAESHESIQDEIRFRFFPVSVGRGRGVGGFGKQWSIALISRLIRERPSLVFLFIGGGWFALTLAVICKGLGIPYCPIVAGWGVATRRSLRWYYGNALRTIVHTEAHKQRFANAGVNTQNFMVMPMGVDTQLFRAKPQSAYLRVKDDVRFIHVGRIVPGKNLIGALKVLSQVRGVYPNVVLDVVGPISDQEYWIKAQQFISGHSLEKQVCFHGKVENAVLPALYAQADLMLFPTLSESFGFVIAESMACGTPVVALRGAGSPEEIIEDGVDGILADEEQLAERTIALLEQPHELARMGVQAAQKIRRCYSHEQTYRDIRKLLREAVTESTVTR